MATPPAQIPPERVTIASGELRLAGLLHLPAGTEAAPLPGVVVCHGLGSRKENHADFVRVLASHGFAALAFDARGHGESPGELDEGIMGDLLAAVDYLAGHPRVDPSRLAVRGSSFGGQTAIHAAAASDRIRALVALCPSHEGLMLSRYGDPENRARMEALEASIRVNRHRFLGYLAGQDVVRSAGRVAPRPLLLVHCRGDETVPFQLSERLLQAASEPKELWAIEGGSHGWAQHDPGTQLRVTRWLQDRIGSGRDLP